MSFFRKKNKEKEASSETVVALNIKDTIIQATPPNNEEINFWLDNSKI